MSTNEELSPHEELARELEDWRRDYYMEVRTVILRQDWQGGVTAFEKWEKGFIKFLKDEVPSLNETYNKKVKSKLPQQTSGDSVSGDWRRSKGNDIEAFFLQAIKDARSERLIVVSANDAEVFSPHEILADDFNDFLEAFYGSDIVKKDLQGGMSFNWAVQDFSRWEQQFLDFLADEVPSLLKSYIDNVQGESFLSGSNEKKRPKVKAIENFLRTAIADALEQKLITVSTNDFEDLPPHEKLASKFERWKKDYDFEVIVPFFREDLNTGNIAFDSWEQRFLLFLTNEAPSLLPIYGKNVQGRTVSWPEDETIFSGWFLYKGDAVEAFFALAIRQAREQKLITIPINSSLLLSTTVKPKTDGKIFIGHGRSSAWRDLKDFLQDRLHLQWDEFNREATAGHTTVERLKGMLDEASFAFLVMTAEDEHADQKLHARQNVIHEIGLFQGKLGFNKAIILLEEGCERFSNIDGLTYIPFPKGNIEAAFEKVRRVLERERIL